ncbi:hypothetical protein N9J36_04630 [Litoricola sp.]|nr:hypothetical protein [Litorivicinus sp.]
MLGYFILFLIVGFITSKVMGDEKTTFIIFTVISIGWGVSFGPIWGLVTFGELAAGFVLNKMLN